MGKYFDEIYKSIPLEDSSGMKLNSCLADSYRTMNMQRESTVDKKGKKLRRCNRCGKYFLKSNTIIARYTKTSVRRHRMCLDCFKLIGGFSDGK